MKKSFILLPLLFLPSVLSVEAASQLETFTFTDIIKYLIDVVQLLLPILVTVAFIVFFWGLSKFILNSGNKDEIKKGRDYMIWGVFALFVLLTFRVIITFISKDLGLEGDSDVIPQLPTSGETPSFDYKITYPEFDNNNN